SPTRRRASGTSATQGTGSSVAEARSSCWQFPGAAEATRRRSKSASRTPNAVAGNRRRPSRLAPSLCLLSARQAARERGARTGRPAGKRWSRSPTHPAHVWKSATGETRRPRRSVSAEDGIAGQAVGRFQIGRRDRRGGNGGLRSLTRDADVDGREGREISDHAVSGARFSQPFQVLGVDVAG